jgi:hypothetical protein
MTGFELPTNYVENPEAIIRRTRAKLKKAPTTLFEINQLRRSLTPDFEAMADRSLREFSAPTTTNIRTGPTINVGDNKFELKQALINMVQTN